MRRILPLLSLALALILGAPAALAQSPDAMSSNKSKKQYSIYGVAFYNLENLFDTINNNGKYDLEFSPQGSRKWDGNKYWSKVSNLARAIANMPTKTTPQGPAVIGVSEIENITVLQDLVRDPQIKDKMYQVVHHDSPDRRGVDVGLLYNPRLFKLLNVTNHRLVELDFPTRDQMCVVGLMGGDTVAIIVNHWPSRLGGEEKSRPNREAAARLSKAIADSLWAVNPNIGVMIMGDLNDDPDNSSVKNVLNAKKSPKNVASNGFYNPFWKMLADDGIGTLAYKGSWNLFDQIILSGNLLEQNTRPDKLHFMKSIVCNFDFLRQADGAPLRTYKAGVFLNGYSDHFPVEILLVKER